MDSINRQLKYPKAPVPTFSSVAGPRGCKMFKKKEEPGVRAQA
jgi:hypothetical protein